MTVFYNFKSDFLMKNNVSKASSVLIGGSGYLKKSTQEKRQMLKVKCNLIFSMCSFSQGYSFFQSLLYISQILSVVDCLLTQSYENILYMCLNIFYTWKKLKNELQWASLKFCLCKISSEAFPAGPKSSLVATKWPPWCQTRNLTYLWLWTQCRTVPS